MPLGVRSIPLRYMVDIALAKAPEIMGIGIRIENLRKVYDTPPPMAGRGAGGRERGAGELLEKFKLTDRATDMVRTFSGGMMQRLSIARAMMHEPEVLFLDEPSAGLDPQTRLLLWEIVRDYNRLGKTIVLTTHYMDEADELCERLAIIDHGRIIAQGTPAELKASIPGGYLLRMRFDK